MTEFGSRAPNFNRSIAKDKYLTNTGRRNFSLLAKNIVLGMQESYTHGNQESNNTL